MATLSSKAAYVKGLADGLDIAPDTKEHRLLLAIVDALADMAEAVSQVETAQTELDEYVSSVDEDVRTLEAIIEDVFSDEDDDDDDDYDFFDDDDEDDDE